MRKDNRSEDFTMSSVKSGGSPRQTRSRPNSKDAIEQNGEPTSEMKVTATTVTSEGLGSRQMTLYLSRTTSMLKPGSASPQKTDDNSEKKDSLPVQNGLSHVALQREFTFTGYDIMADSKCTICCTRVQQARVVEIRCNLRHEMWQLTSTPFCC